MGSTETKATTEPFFLDGSRPALRFRPRRTFGQWGKWPVRRVTTRGAPSSGRAHRLPRYLSCERRDCRGYDPTPGPGSALPDVPRRAPSRSRFLSTLRGERVGSPVTDARANAEGVKWDDERHDDRPRILHRRDGLTRRAPVVRRTRDRDARAPPRVTPPHGGGGEQPAFRVTSLEPPPPRGAFRRRRVARGPRHGR